MDAFRCRPHVVDGGALHLQIEQQHVARSPVEKLVEPLDSVRLTDDDDLVAEPEQRLQPLAEEGVIVRDRESDRRGHCLTLQVARS